MRNYWSILNMLISTVFRLFLCLIISQNLKIVWYAVRLKLPKDFSSSISHDLS